MGARWGRRRVAEVIKFCLETSYDIFYVIWDAKYYRYKKDFETHQWTKIYGFAIDWQVLEFFAVLSARLALIYEVLIPAFWCEMESSHILDTTVRPRFKIFSGIMHPKDTRIVRWVREIGLLKIRCAHSWASWAVFWIAYPGVSAQHFGGHVHNAREGRATVAVHCRQICVLVAEFRYVLTLDIIDWDFNLVTSIFSADLDQVSSWQIAWMVFIWFCKAWCSIRAFR